MNREEMAAQLTKLREERLRQEVTCLKERSNRRQVIEQTLANATIAAQETTGLNLQDLGLFGKIRLDCFKLGKELSRQILQHSERVTRAKKIAESGRAAHQEIVAKRLAAQETLDERDTEHFLSWNRNRKD